VAKTPEEWLEEVSPKERTEGILKLFLGYAPGVGKTFSMLSEAIRRRSRGEDVVIGFVETHGRKGIAELAAQLEQVPRRKIEYKGTVFEEMDPDAIKSRNPRVVLVDELAHTNIPGSKHRKRYEDVLDLVESKFEVLSTVNVQHLESIAPTVGAITGIKIRETVPDWVMEHANEIVMVDLTPEALQNRMKRGEVYHTEKVDQALKNRPGTTMVVVNSICGCAAGRMRPAVRMALQNSVRPDHAYSVFAGQETDATERVRSYFTGYPPSSPSIGILRDGELVYMMQRRDIESREAPAIAADLKAALDKLCGKPATV